MRITMLFKIFLIILATILSISAILVDIDNIKFMFETLITLIIGAIIGYLIYLETKNKQ